MAVDDIIGIQIHGRYQMQNIVNVMHYEVTEQTSDDHELLGQFCTQWETQHKSGWLARHIDSYSLMGLKGFSITGANKRPGIVHINDPGAIVGEEAPSPICRVVTLYTDSDNYRRRGRIMLSGSADAHFNDADGAVTDVELAAMVILGEALILPMTFSGNTTQPGLRPQGILTFEQFTAAQSRRTPACIRSRRVRGFSIG